MSQSKRPATSLLASAMSERSKLTDVEAATAAGTATSPTKRKQQLMGDVEMIDLTEDDAAGALECVTPPSKRPRLVGSAARTTSATKTPSFKVARSDSAVADVMTPTRSPDVPSNTTPAAEAPNDPSATLPTPNPTPQKNQDLPMLADRYVHRTSTADQIVYTNPHEFAVKPAYWRGWHGQLYAYFAEYLQDHIDLSGFAKEHELSVEEVKSVFSAVVRKPLYSVKEARKRGEEGMEEIMGYYQKYGTKTRSWALETTTTIVVGELNGIEKPDLIDVIKEDGTKMQLRFGDLSTADKKYLQATLSPKDVRILREGREEVLKAGGGKPS